MPGPLRLPTHVTRLPDGLAASLEVPPEDWPLRAITMGIGTIRSARRIVVLATGETKATAVWMLAHGPEDPQWPCSFLNSHDRLDLLVDPGAARALDSGAELM
jgi:glucosamine-6-phosphate deaminase